MAVNIIADSREARSGLLAELTRLGAQLRIEQNCRGR